MSVKADHGKDGDGLPLPDPVQFEAWRQEALQKQPHHVEWAHLVASLRHVQDLETKGFENSELPPGLTSIERSINLLIWFLSSQNALMGQNLVGPLLRLHAGIIDLADGRVAEIFKPKKKPKGHPGIGTTDSFVMGIAARAMDELVKAGVTPSKAADRVASSFPHKRASGREKPRGATIKNWRDRLMAGVGPGAPQLAVDHYNAELPPGMGDTPALRAKNLLLALRRRSAAQT